MHAHVHACTHTHSHTTLVKIPTTKGKGKDRSRRIKACSNKNQDALAQFPGVELISDPELTYQRDDPGTLWGACTLLIIPLVLLHWSGTKRNIQAFQELWDPGPEQTLQLHHGHLHWRGSHIPVCTPSLIVLRASPHPSARRDLQSVGPGPSKRLETIHNSQPASKEGPRQPNRGTPGACSYGIQIRRCCWNLQDATSPRLGNITNPPYIEVRTAN